MKLQTTAYRGREEKFSCPYWKHFKHTYTAKNSRRLHGFWSNTCGNASIRWKV